MNGEREMVKVYICDCHVNNPRRRELLSIPHHLHKENKERADDTVPPWSETDAWL